MRAFVIESLNGGVLISNMMQNCIFVQQKGVREGIIYKLDDVFTEDLDYGFGKITILPWYQLAVVQTSMIRSPEDFLRI